MKLSRIIISAMTLRGLLTVAALYSLLRVQLLTFADDPGLGWHLGLGRLLWNGASLPLRDPFLHYVGLAPRWVCDQWLADVALYGLFTQGWPVLYGVLTLVFLLSFFWGLCGFLRSAGIGLAASLLVTVLCFKLAQVHFIARPLVFNVPLLLLAYWLSHEMVRGKVSLWRIGVLPLSLALWANIHGSFVVGLAICLFASGLLAMQRLREAQIRSSLSWGLYALILFASSLCTPYGFELFTNIFSQVGSSYFKELLEEWRPLSLTSFEGLFFLFALGVLLFSFLRNLRSLTLVLVFEFCIAAGFAWYSVQHIRMLPLFSIAAALPLARGFADIWRICAARLPVLPLFSSLSGHERRNAPGAAFFLLLSALLLLGVSLTDSVPFGPERLGPSARKFPIAALENLRSRLPDSSQAVVAAHPNWGGFLTFYGEGRVRAIVDDRNRMRGEAFYREYFDAFGDPSKWPQFLTEQGAQYLLAETGTTLAKQLREEQGVQLCFEDEVALLVHLDSACPPPL